MRAVCAKRAGRLLLALSALVLAAAVAPAQNAPPANAGTIRITIDDVVVDESHRAIKFEALSTVDFPATCQPDKQFAQILVDTTKKTAKLCTGTPPKWTPVTSSFLKGLIEADKFPYVIQYSEFTQLDFQSTSKGASAPSLCLEGKRSFLPICLKLRQSVADKNKINKPAQFQITEPRHGKADWAADVGLTALGPNWATDYFQLEYGPTVEFHRQTAPSNPQKSFLSGITTTAILGDIAEWPNLAHFLHFDAQYKDDREKSARGFQCTLDYNPLWVQYRAFSIGEVMDLGSLVNPAGAGLLQTLWQPTTGFDYDGIYKAKKKDPTGSVGRWYANVEIAFYPLGGTQYLDDRLQLIGAFSNWYIIDAAENLARAGDHVDLTTVTLVYYLDSFKQFGISVQYLNGANPRLAQPEQKFWQIGFAASLG